MDRPKHVWVKVKSSIRVSGRGIYECRYDKRLEKKIEESTRLTCTGLFGELEHLNIKTRYSLCNLPDVLVIVIFLFIMNQYWVGKEVFG